MPDNLVILPGALPPDLLEYGFSTLPAPLQVSTSSATSPGAVNLWVAPPTGETVFCSKLNIAVPIGKAGTDLSDKAPSLTPNTTWWAVSSLVFESGDNLGFDAQTRYAVFTAVCPSSTHWEIDYDLQFSLITPSVNEAEGTFGLVVAEMSGPSETAREQRRSVFDLTKGPAVDYLGSVVTTPAPPAASDVPVSAFSSGEAIRLAWESNAASFAVHIGADPTPVWTGTDTSVVLDKGVANDATLTVVATGAGGPLLADTRVTITNPTIVPTALTAGTLTTAGATVLAGAALATLSAQTLGVTQGSTLRGGVTASVLTASGGSTFTEGLTASSVDVSGGLVANDVASLGAVSLATLRVASKVSMMSPHQISAGSYVASTDGVVLGTVTWPSNAGRKCAAVAYGASAGVGTVYARGGNREFWTNGKSTSMWMVGNTFVLPVKRGNGFSLGAHQAYGADEAAPTSFVWVPFGTSATLQSLSAEEATAYGLDEMIPPPPEQVEVPRVAGEVVPLLHLVAEILGDRLTPEQGRRLRAAVLTLITRHQTTIPSTRQSFDRSHP